MSTTLTNPTAAEILAYLVQSSITPSPFNDEGVFESPFRLALTFGKGKKAITYTLMLAVTHDQLWASSWGIEGREIFVTHLPKMDVALDETWEAAMTSALSSLANFTKGHEETHKEADPVLDELYELLNKEAGELAQVDTPVSAETITGSEPADVTTLSPEVNPKEFTCPTTGRLMVRVDALEISPGLQAVPMISSVVAALLGSSKADSRDSGAEMSHERDAFHSSLDELGIKEALKCHRDESGQLWLDDGRHRMEWAVIRGIDAVPFMEVTEEEGAALVESTVIGRRHWTKGQRAYLGVIMHPEVAGVKRGRPGKKNPIQSELNATSLAERLGVSADVVSQAIQLYTLFHAPTAKKGSAEAIEAADLKGKFEISIWAGNGLGGVLAGIGGGKVTKDTPKKASGFHGLDKPLGTITTLSKSWMAWDEGERKKALKLITTRFKEIDPGFRLALSEALAAAEE